MLVPIFEAIVQGLNELIQIIKASPFKAKEGNCFHHGSITVQPAGMLGDELQLHFGPGLSKVSPCSVAGSKAPCIHSWPRRP